MLKRLKKIRKFPPLLTKIFYLILRLYSLLVFKKTKDIANTVRLENFPFVTVTWHNRILFAPIMFKKEYRRSVSAIISSSRDGEYLADLLALFGISSIRGSTKKKALVALNESTRRIAEGKTVFITPDGPRGPRGKMSQGPVIIASKMSVPIVPLSINYSNYWELHTWDLFRIPKPFSTVTVVIGEPMKIPPDISDAELEKWRIVVENKLNEIS